MSPAQEFYSALKRCDPDAMTALYSSDIEFHDPAFGPLKRERAKDMWRMLCGAQTDLKLEFDVLEESEINAKVKWVAMYTFGKEKRLVVNQAVAHLSIENGLIVKHLDDFNLHKWARQALGLKGALLGWTGFFKAQLQKQTNSRLDRWREKNS